MNFEKKILNNFFRLLKHYNNDIYYESVLEDFYDVFNGYNHYGALRFVIDVQLEDVLNKMNKKECEKFINFLITSAYISVL